MGLDMYLEKETYLGLNLKHRRNESQDFPDLSAWDINKNRITTINERVAYWRKANHIHQWFVDNVQDGVDDCKRYYVSSEQLQDLCNLCKAMLNSTDEERAIELPTQAGFFFGSYEYDEWYEHGLNDTIVQIEAALKEPDNCGFYYQSSW